MPSGVASSSLAIPTKKLTNVWIIKKYPYLCKRIKNGPLVKRLTRCPFTAEARVRIPYGLQYWKVGEWLKPTDCKSVLARVRGFESLPSNKNLKITKKGVKTFYIYINIIKTMKNLNNISTAKIGGGAGANVTGWIML